MPNNANVYIQGSTALSPAMQDVMRGHDAYYERNLARLGEEFQLEQIRSVAGLGAQRLAQYGPEGEWWAEQLVRDPNGAYLMAEQMGGFGEIENRLASARASGAASQAIGQMQQSGASPREIVEFVLRTQGPDAAKKTAEALGMGSEAAGPASYKTEEGVYIRDPSAPDGYRRVGSTPKAGPLVQIGESGLKPEQVVAAEDRAASHLAQREKPLNDALEAYRAFRALAEKVAESGRPPTPAETDSLAKLAARLENPEAVMEGDIARKAGGSLSNFFAGMVGLPYTLSLEQLDGLVATADTIAAEKQASLDALRSGAQGVAEGRGLNPSAVVPVAPRSPSRPQPTSASGGRRVTGQGERRTVNGAVYERDPAGGWVRVQ